MKLSHALSRTQSSDSLVRRKHIPWLSSPLDKAAMGKESAQGVAEESELTPDPNVLQFDESHVSRKGSQVLIFKKHHDSSTIELFYDLFFVANLSTFTHNHEVTDGKSLTSYMGFFTLLWFTWLETSLFDVRFSSDSVINRIAKAVSFGVMTGFAVVSSRYDHGDLATDNFFTDDTSAFRATALILMVSRLALVGQYGLVLWYVKDYRNTLVPIALTMGVLFVSAMIFLGTYFGFPGDRNLHIYVGWYTVVVAEAVAVIVISCIWRVVSFKHTHLVERAGLLTLIVMGEGIIGMTGSVSNILQNSVSVSSRLMGTVTASVLLIYFIWVLYFDQIEHDRFGTIHQQIWALLHYPLHVGILLTGEGSTQLLLWNIIVENIYLLDNSIWDPTWFASTADYVSSLNTNLTDFNNRFRVLNFTDCYDYTVNLTSIASYQNITVFNSQGYNETNNLTSQLLKAIILCVFDNFNIDVPESGDESSSTDDNKLDSLFNIFETVFLYFFIASGCLLIVLGVLYWFGKRHKSRWELFSILIRVLVGVGLSLAAISSNFQTGVNLLLSAWMIPIAVITYFIVIALDNILVWHSNKTMAHSIEYHQSISGSDPA